MAMSPLEGSALRVACWVMRNATARVAVKGGGRRPLRRGVPFLGSGFLKTQPGTLNPEPGTRACISPILH